MSLCVCRMHVAVSVGGMSLCPYEACHCVSVEGMSLCVCRMHVTVSVGGKSLPECL